jgi:hypothetical protein
LPPETSSSVSSALPDIPCALINDASAAMYTPLGSTGGLLLSASAAASALRCLRSLCRRALIVCVILFECAGPRAFHS